MEKINTENYWKKEKCMQNLRLKRGMNAQFAIKNKGGVWKVQSSSGKIKTKYSCRETFEVKKEEGGGVS